MRIPFSIVASALVLAICSTAGAGTKVNQGHGYGGVPGAVRAKMQGLIHKAFDRYGIGNLMVCIAGRESGFNPMAANYGDSNGGSYGLFQINGIHRWAGESLRHFEWRMWNPYSNISFAVRLYRTSGLGPWGGGC